MKKEYIFGLIGIAIGAFLMNWLFFPEITTETLIETKIETDTVFVTKIDTVYQNSITHRVIRDTVLLEPIKPEIKEFTASFHFLYGNAHLKGEVLGEVLKTSLTNDFKFQTITNTINIKETIIKKPSGLFLTAGVNHNLTYPSIGAIFIKNRYLFGLNTSGFQIGYKVNK